MKKSEMGSETAAGIHHPTHPSKVFAWLWHAFLEAMAEVPALRWLGLALAATAALTVYLAMAEGKSALDMAVYGAIAALFVLSIPLVLYFLFEIYRKHRSDAIFDSKRLAHLIQKIAREEIETSDEAKLALENTLLMLQPEKGSRRTKAE